MTLAEFKGQVERLIKTYGPDKYPQERVNLIWDEFKGMQVHLFETIVSRLIGENSTPPMLPKFRELAASFRERIVVQEKKEHSQIAQAFRNGFDQEETRVIVAGILNILDEKNSGARWNKVRAHIAFIDSLARAKERQSAGSAKDQ